MQIGRNAPCPFMKVTASACAANSKPAGWTRCPTCRCWRFCSTTPSPAPIPIRLPTGCWSASGLCPAFWKPRRTELLKIDGMGDAAAQLLCLIPQLERRHFIDRSGKANILNSTSKCGQYLVPFFHGEQEEVVYLLCLDAKCKALCCVPVHRGSITVASISVRKIVQTALNQNAASVVLRTTTRAATRCRVRRIWTPRARCKPHCRASASCLPTTSLVADDDYVSLADDGYLGGSYGL